MKTKANGEMKTITKGAMKTITKRVMKTKANGEMKTITKGVVKSHQSKDRQNNEHNGLRKNPAENKIEQHQLLSNPV